MSEKKYELSTFYIDARMNDGDGGLQSDLLTITNNVSEDRHEPLEASVKYKHDLQDEPWVELKLETSDMDINIMLGKKDEAREFINWLDKQVPKLE